MHALLREDTYAPAHALVARLEPFFVAPAKLSAALVTGSTTRHEIAETLFAYYFISIACCVGIMIFSLVFSRRCIVGAKRFDALRPCDRNTWHTNLCTFWPAFAVTMYAAPAIGTFAGRADSFTGAVSTLTAKACGMSIGYMTWDLFVIVSRWKDQLEAYGGAGALRLFIVHHVFSIVLWPYALTRGLCAYHINYFLVSEVTNFNMSLRWILSALKLSDSKLYLVNGLSWIPLFMGVLVVVIPRLYAAFMGSDWSVFTPAQYWAALLTLPIPSALNVYWAQQIVVGATKFLLTGEEPGAAKKKED
jgi:hypothetical protein